MQLKGVHSVKMRLAGGKTATYHYAWRGGPRLTGKPGTDAFTNSYNAAIASRKVIPTGTMFSLIASYRASSEFKSLADRTQKDYRRYLAMIEAKFGGMPLDVLDDPRVRGDFKEWRDSLAHSPRAADLAWTILARVLSVAKDRGKILTNPCERGGRLSKADRSDRIWSEEMVAKALATFPKPLAWVLHFAVWTGQRQGDLLKLTWRAIDGDVIRLKQGKRGRRVNVPISKPLRAVLETIPKRSPVILTSSDKKPWTSDGFRASWRRACARAGIEGVTFHDLRGTTVTRLAEEGAPEAEIATITGHSLRDVGKILDAYLGRTQRLGESAIARLERKETRTQSVKKV